jgi:hypothetical protein
MTHDSECDSKWGAECDCGLAARIIATLEARVKELEGALRKVGCLDADHGRGTMDCAVETPFDLCVVCAALAPKPGGGA